MECLRKNPPLSPFEEKGDFVLSGLTSALLALNSLSPFQ
ncbi:hypothetical protein ADICYQ_4429 [Cyclobacterium qasimii M12-11B]|uniref:Uncharacterized protein n=1 Tax=Cyclobacterium qasimii M12-11B TaxID=641524 RepID=S7VAB8_9BACT|nr:hypothetical protein ADICYQ_4429 [Cyclobacterium qasimii M12-11B]